MVRKFCSNELPKKGHWDQMEYKTLGQSVGSMHLDRLLINL